MSQHNHSVASAPASSVASDAGQLEFDGQAGAALHRHRRRLGLTATEVARRVGISQRRMSRLELGLEPLTLRLAIGLGAALGMPAGWFLGLDAAAIPDAILGSLQGTHHDWIRGLTANLSQPEKVTS